MSAAPPPNDVPWMQLGLSSCARPCRRTACAGARRTEDDVKDCLTIARLLRSSSESSWLLKPREGEIFALRRRVSRYALAAGRLPAPHCIETEHSDGTLRISLQRHNGKASANDGGWLWLLLRSQCGDVNLRDVGCTQILRKEARLALPALADLATALGHGGKGDVPMLLGAASRSWSGPRASTRIDGGTTRLR